jgi:hypothetical protein
MGGKDSFEVSSHVGWVDVRKPNTKISVEFSTSMLGCAALNPTYISKKYP